MTPASKRKFTIAVNEYRSTFLTKARHIALNMESGSTVSDNDKRAFIEANHKHSAADHLRWLLEGAE